jgi:hypothetical protein
VADINGIANALATRIATSTGIRAYPNAPGQVVPPAVVVIPDRPAIMYGQTMDGETTVNLLAIVVLSAANDTSGQTLLNNFVSSSGAQSVNAAVNADPSLAGTVEFAVVLQVSSYGLIEYAGQQYIGGSFLVQCGAHL